MLRSYLKVAWRHLWRHKLYSVINVTGLAVGFAVALLIGLFVWQEWTHDSFHANGEHIYRIIGQEEKTGNRTAVMDGPLAPLLEEHLPQIQRYARTASSTLRVGEGDARAEEKVYFADPAFLEMFSFPLAAGSASTALEAPDAVVLSQDAARRFFGTENPIGQPLPIEFKEDTREMTVTGVLEPIPSASSMKFDMLLPLSTYAHTSNWGEDILKHRRGWVGDAFLQLSEGTTAEELVPLINEVVDKHYEDIPTNFASRAVIERYTLQPLQAMYFSPEVESSTVASSNPLYSYVLGGIGGIVLLLACINFATLAIGRSASRAKEVGMRKTVGARPAQVRWQFLSETFLVTGAALLLGLLLARVALPVFNTLADRTLTLAPLLSPGFLACVAGGLVFVGLVAGGYPAWVLSRFQPRRVLHGSSADSSGKPAGLISGLVVVQFALSIALLIGALVMDQQLRYAQQGDLGFDREQVLAVENTSDMESDDLLARLRQQLKPHPEVRQLAGASDIFGLSGTDFRLIAGDTLATPVHRLRVDENYPEVLGIELKGGRALSSVSRPEDPTQKTPPALVNEAFLEAMGWSQDEVIGRRLPIRAGNVVMGGGKVVGIVENFHLRSLRHPIEPMIIQYDPTSTGHLLVRMAPGKAGTALRQVEAAWHEAVPDAPFAHRFLDEVVQAQYEDDRRWATVVRYAVVLTLLISCFGLFGLSALAARRRYREIGIRKVLGASTASIVALLSKDFLKLIAVAFVLAVPVAYVGMSRWLEDFAYRIELVPWIFLGAGLIALFIALLTVSTQALRAAWTDPATAIRQE